MMKQTFKIKVTLKVKQRSSSVLIYDQHKFNSIDPMTYAFVITIFIDSMTSMFNTDALLSYKHDVFENLIVEKRVKVDGEGT
ncbi:hypothetical protein T265_05636 [Opisthorchis viverrini]|uniref:Uncharacterized protein n=1 Tax=Opisthorchis viverrini TaxID=6198 RepID=A0A074ZNG8_OPIVI|nr:hypothetical protein T265_05636 [Opisthorchis viverrini]KER27312.1 hypothetical protein T265_05636 [Opisthorchis viverrini]